MFNDDWGQQNEVVNWDKNIQTKNIQTQDYLGKTVWVWVLIFCLNHVDTCLSSSLHSASVDLAMWTTVPDLTSFESEQ